MRNVKDQIEQALKCFVENDERNAMPAHHNLKIYDAPLIGYAAADDEYFDVFRNEGIVGPSFLLPQQWLPGAKTVISFFLPFAREIRESNRLAGLPSEEWVSARIDGEVFNNTVRDFLADWLKELGAEAMAPARDPRFTVKDRISNWSERHVAHAAGLGTFGLHRALITAKGTAGRFGSVITTLALEATPRPYTGRNDSCLFFAKGTCGACIRRCPPGAITKAGKDNKACSDYMDAEVKPRFAPRYGCAKCNTAVPCEYRSPV